MLLRANLFLLLYLLGTIRVSEFSKTTLATGKPVLVLCHEGSLAASRTIASSPCYLIPLNIVEFIDGNLSLTLSLFVSHYLFAPPEPPDFEVAASCLALSLDAFSSSSTFFLSSLDNFLNSL
jgi:hypothetical protein